MEAYCDVPWPMILFTPANRPLEMDQQLERAVPQPTIRDVVRELSRMGDGVPTIVQRDKQGRQQLFFCTPAFIVRCTLTGAEDAYTVRLRSLDFLYRVLPNWAAIMVRADGWESHEMRSRETRTAHREIVKASHDLIASYAEKYQAFVARSQSQAVPDAAPDGLSAAHRAYLEQLERENELSRDVEEDRCRTKQPAAFQGVYATNEKYTARDSYRFRLDGSCRFVVGDSVWVGLDGFNVDGPRERGRVITMDPPFVTIKFDRQLDLARLGNTGLIGVEFNPTQHHIRQQAIEALRNQTASNNRLLHVFVDHDYLPFKPGDFARLDSLNEPQQEVVRSGLTVPDMFLVMGPPGTGKTHTIAALVTELVRKEKKVLITSKNNPAVDNVLVELKGMTVVRVGHEIRVADGAQSLLIDNQARALQQRITAGTAASLQTYQTLVRQWCELEADVDGLRVALSAWRERLRKRAVAHDAVGAAQHAVWHKYQHTITAAHQALLRAYRRADRRTRRANRSWVILETCAGLRTSLLLGLVATALSGWLARRAARATEQAKVDRARYIQAVSAYLELTTRYRTDVQGAPNVLHAKRTAQEADQNCAEIQSRVDTDAARLHTRVTVSPPLIAPPDTRSPDTLAPYLDTIPRLRSMIDWRAALLMEWHDLLLEHHRELYSALIRCANVVGATCIGIATDSHFRDLEFDVVIADEAGQIQVSDLIVPLVRAKRAILVGDHQQLPPFVDTELCELLKEDEQALIRIRQSIFEQLYGQAESTHKAMLSIQHRMPASIANFISQEFYQAQYHSAPERQIEPSDDPFFRRPFCFVDTLHRTDYIERRELKQDEDIDEGYSYTNEGEARLLVRLVSAYVGTNRLRTIGVIVPYKRQVALIRRLLAKRHPDLTSELAMVATVDSFQGGQRDIILFGFTRSNDEGVVGFLSELRRLNVTLTRARRQLILIGDQQTLVRARNAKFRRFAAALLAYIERHGQRSDIDELDQVLHGRGC